MVLRGAVAPRGVDLSLTVAFHRGRLGWAERILCYRSAFQAVSRSGNSCALESGNGFLVSQLQVELKLSEATHHTHLEPGTRAIFKVAVSP